MVLSYLLATTPELRPDAESLRFNEKPLEEKTLYMCFNDTEEGRALRTTFNEGLKQVEVDALVDAYFVREFE
jgi:polar amino acid transport system substrate-binding protein